MKGYSLYGLAKLMRLLMFKVLFIVVELSGEEIYLEVGGFNF